MNLAESLQQLVEARPTQPAVHLQQAGKPDTTISYEALWRGAAQYARAFVQHRLDPGSVVVLILQHGEELIYAFWGAVVAGVIPSIMPFLTEKLSPEQYRRDLKALMGVTRPAAVVTYPAFASHVQEASLASERIELVLTTDLEADGGAPPSPGREHVRQASDIVLLQHSSGTTGLQKGVALSHEAVLRQLEAYGEAIGLGTGDVIVSWLPLYHDMGLIAGFLMPILSGVPLVLSSPFDWVRAPWRMLRAVSDYRGTLSWLPNFAYNFMADKVRDRDLEGIELSSWRAVINCSEPVRWESHRAFFDRFEGYGLRWESLQTCYAMAENVFGVTQSDLTRGPSLELLDREEFLAGQIASAPDESKPTMRVMSSGVPLRNTRVKIVDAQGQELPNHHVGEIALTSDCMLNGYYNRPDADQTAFRDGWYLTGDFGFLAGGELYVVGRKKDLIIVGGKNIYPQDLEGLAYAVKGIHAGRSVAFGVFNEELGTEDVYMVAEADTEDPSVQNQLAEQIRRQVTQHSAISLRHVRVVGPRWIIKTSSGKTARSANKDKFLKELGAANGRKSPLT